MSCLGGTVEKEQRSWRVISVREKVGEEAGGMSLGQLKWIWNEA